MNNDAHLILAKRLTDEEKKEIIKSFKSGIDIDSLAQKYTCTNSTVIRNLKKDLGEFKYKEFFDKSKFLKRKSLTNKNQTNDLLETNIDNENPKINSNDPNVLNENIIASNFDPVDSFLRFLL